MSENAPPKDPKKIKIEEIEKRKRKKNLEIDPKIYMFKNILLGRTKTMQNTHVLKAINDDLKKISLLNQSTREELKAHRGQQTPKGPQKLP